MGRLIKRTGFVPPNNSAYRYRDGSRLEPADGYRPHLSTRFRNWGTEVLPAIKARSLPELYRNRFECCGCTACAAICPCDAISMDLDEEGFLYPVVDAAQCVRCGKCMTVCTFKDALIER